MSNETLKPVAMVKPLEWVRPTNSITLTRAGTPLGFYRVWTHHEAAGKWFWQGPEIECRDRPYGTVNDEGEGHAAAQADYESRILSALVPAPQVQGCEPVAWMVSNAMVPHQPVKARGWSNEPFTGIYPAVRENDAKEAARILRAECEPLYPASALASLAKERSELEQENSDLANVIAAHDDRRLRIAALEAALSSLPEQGWRTMESAPKDGRKLLLLFDGPFHDTLETGHAVGMWTGDSWYLTCIWATSSAHREPVAWQPLPAPTPSGKQ